MSGAKDILPVAAIDFGYKAGQLPTYIQHVFDLTLAAENQGYRPEVQGVLAGI